MYTVYSIHDMYHVILNKSLQQWEILNVNKLSWISEANQQFVFEGVLGGSSHDV